VGQLAVIGNEEQPLGPFIKATDGKEPGIRRRQQIDDPRPAGGIRTRAQTPLRLVDEVIQLAVDFQAIAIDRDFLRFDVGPCPEFGDCLPINRHAAGGDQFLTRAARTKPGGGEQFL